tara:strand:+ start:1317 stop:1745 length:429 start_codon:yes stop_codon:yes gene_type:complete
MLLDKRNYVFVAERIDTPGAWQMPQGGIDKGEEPLAAAWRELEEEIGTRHAELIAESQQWLTYDLPANLRGKVWKGKYRGQKQKWYVLRFTGQESDINLNTAHPEFAAWKWSPMADLPRMIVPFKQALYQTLLDEFGYLASL